MAVRVYLQTFGCRANQYDSEAVAAMVAAGGGTIVVRVEDADVAVFNSCAVTAEAEADLRQQVRRAARQAPHIRSIVMGCASARSGDQLAALPGVRHVIAGAELDAVGAAIGIDAVASVTGAVAQRGTRGLLRIQDGCDEHCTFCATTLARGASRSRSIDALVEEAHALAAFHPEIVLTGIHIGTYGRDRDTTLAALVAALVASVPSVRFRLSSIEATEVDDALAALLTGGANRVAPHLHAPLQSGSAAVLRRMGRHWYDPASYAAAVERLVTRATGPFGLGADIIAGFPGESDADHRATCAFVERLPFTALHVFPYSARPGTAALRLGAEVPADVRRERAAELRAIATARAAAHATARVGTAADVIVIGDPGGTRHGLTEDYLTVELEPPAPARATRFSAMLAPGASPLRPVAIPIA